VAAWAPWLTVAGIAADVVVQFTGTTATWPVTALWGLLTITFGYVGMRVLAMPPQEWAATGPAGPAPARPTVAVEAA
jgi:hypothetical protein